MREVHNPQCVLSFLHLSSLSPWLVNNLLIARTSRAPLPYSTKWSLLIFRLFQLCVSMDFLVDHVGSSAFLVGVGSHGDWVRVEAIGRCVLRVWEGSKGEKVELFLCVHPIAFSSENSRAITRPIPGRFLWLPPPTSGLMVWKKCVLLSPVDL